MLRGKSGGSKQGFAALFSKQSSVAISTAVSSYDSMSWAELRACCGKKHGNSISAAKKDNEGRWKPKSKKELMSELKNAAMFRSKSAGSKQGLAALFSKQSSAAISTDTVLASSTAMSLPGVAQPLVGSEPAGRQRAFSLWSMKLSQLQAWCGKKHGSSIKAAKKDNKGQ